MLRTICFVRSTIRNLLVALHIMVSVCIHAYACMLLYSICVQVDTYSVYACCAHAAYHIHSVRDAVTLCGYVCLPLSSTLCIAYMLLPHGIRCRDRRLTSPLWVQSVCRIYNRHGCSYACCSVSPVLCICTHRVHTLSSLGYYSSALHIMLMGSYVFIFC